MNAMDLLLAQATETGGGEAAPSGQEGQTGTVQKDGGATPEPGQGDKPTGFNMSQLFLFAAIGIIFYIFMFRGPRKRQQEQKMMLAGIKKTDKVQTIGGIIGTVVDVRDDEVVLKIDEANNTKMHILRSAIGRVIKTEETTK